MNRDKILDVKDLTISFKTDNGIVRAVRGVSFDLSKGETLCIVGESGSGKSVTSKAIMGILAANAIVDGGQIMYEGENLLEVSEDEFHRIRGKKIGMIFQDPLSSLNPIVRIGKQITEAMLINSNKLAIMYNDLIAKEVSDYKNLIAKANVHISREESSYQSKYNEIKAKLGSEEITEEEKKILNQELLQAKNDKNNKIKAIKADLKTNLPELKDKLNARKAFAKEEVKKYKEKVNAEYQTKLADLKPKLESALTASKTKVSKAKVDNANALSDYKAKYEGYLKEYKSILASTSEPIKVLELKKAHQAKLNAFDEIKKEVIKSNQARMDEALSEYTNAKKALDDAKNEYVDKLKITRKEAKRRALEIMSEVGIPLPKKRFRQYPFEFSGGMRQRIVIAIALTAAPEILICDEPTTALDVTIQAQILELIKKIQKERNLSCIFITHDLGVVANMADRVAVMYAGKIVEYGNVDEIFFQPKHPYTWALLSSIPDVDSKERLEAIPGTPPNMIYPPKGDAFALRSKYAMKIDFEHQPPFFKVSDTHYAATWLLHPDAPKVEMPKIVSERIKNSLNAQKEAAENE